MLLLSITFEFVESVSRRNSQVFQTDSQIDVLEFPPCPP